MKRSLPTGARFRREDGDGILRMTFRWFGADDPVSLANIRQIPGVEGVVSALYDVAVGDAWPRERVEQLSATIDQAGMRLAVVESIPVHEDIKLGLPSRDQLIDNYAESIRSLGETGVPVRVNAPNRTPWRFHRCSLLW